MAETLPAKQESSEIDPLKQKVAELIADGVRPATIAKKLGKGDPKLTRSWRHKIRRWTYNDPKFALAISRSAKAEALIQGSNAVAAVGRRAQRGRVDAFKALNELSGLHNPKVQHEHSGDIKITLATMPRPKAVETVDGLAEEVADAEVVE